MSVGEDLPSADMTEARRCWVLDEGLVHSRSWTPEAAGSYETAASFPSRSCNPGISKRIQKSLKLVFWQNFGETAARLNAAFTLFCLSLFMTSVRAGYPPRYLHRWTETEEDPSQLSNMLEKPKLPPTIAITSVKMQTPYWRMIQFGLLYSYLVKLKLANEGFL